MKVVGGVLLLHGVEMKERDIRKELGGRPILVVDYDFFVVPNGLNDPKNLPQIRRIERIFS